MIFKNVLDVWLSNRGKDIDRKKKIYTQAGRHTDRHQGIGVGDEISEK